MPFKKNWHELGMRQTLLEAVEKGYPAITWSTGQQVKENVGMGIEHASNLYDKALVNYMNDLGKRWGGRVDEATVQAGAAPRIGDRALVHRFVIPDAMRQAIQREGLPLFSIVPPTADFDEQYNTKLTVVEERKFQEWKGKHAPHDSGKDYDLRGAFKAGLKPDPKTGHWPDTFKKPNHPTFSNESKYAPYGEPGYWEGDTFIRPEGKALGEAADEPSKPLDKWQQRKADKMRQEREDYLNRHRPSVEDVLIPRKEKGK